MRCSEREVNALQFQAPGSLIRPSSGTPTSRSKNPTKNRAAKGDIPAGKYTLPEGPRSKSSA
jgi:hypothetical protein